MTWELLEQEEPMLGNDMYDGMAGSEGDGDAQVQITRSKYKHFCFEKSEKIKILLFFRG